MSGNKCKNCGSTDIETDPTRGDAVCTSCGFVLEDQLIVSETQFEEGPCGNAMVVGQFVSNDSSGGATCFGGAFMVNGKESREITMQNARKGIAQLCNALKLSQHHVDTSVNFYKMALNHNLTRGRKQAHNHAACVYITCRTEGTAHMLIDISDVLQICVHELGRTYLKFAQALCIRIPSVDPCLYIMRFASKLKFGKKTQEVSNTALRVVKRMKRDSIHSGRRPAGLCGAALLMAARLHEFNRSPADIVKIVKVHESTLRKRLMEFGETPSSALTLEEFMTVDLEEEQDPPAFKAARKKDRERLQKVENIDMELSELQSEINKQLEIHKSAKGKKCGVSLEEINTEKFIRETSMFAIQSCIEDADALTDDIINHFSENIENSEPLGLGPDITTMGLNASSRKDDTAKNKSYLTFENETGEINISDIDDEELDSYIMSEKEAQYKNILWTKVNEKYLEEQEEREKRRQKEKEEGKPEKKRKRVKKQAKNQTPANSAGEAIEKMLQEKRISNKINYDVLKSLNVSGNTSSQESKSNETSLAPANKSDIKIEQPPLNIKTPSVLMLSKTIGTKMPPVLKPGMKRHLENEDKMDAKKVIEEPTTPANIENDTVDENEDYVDDDIDEEDPTEMSVGQMLGGHGDDEDYYGCDDDGYGDEEY